MPNKLAMSARPGLRLYRNCFGVETMTVSEALQTTVSRPLGRDSGSTTTASESRCEYGSRIEIKMRIEEKNAKQTRHVRPAGTLALPQLLRGRDDDSK